MFIYKLQKEKMGPRGGIFSPTVHSRSAAGAGLRKRRREVVKGAGEEEREEGRGEERKGRHSEA